MENGWHISHLCPYRHKCSTFLLHMQWYSSRVATDFAHKSWHMGRTAPTYTFSKTYFPIYSTVICYATAYLIQVPCYHNCLAVLLCSFYYHKCTHGCGLRAKLKLCQYKFIMVTRRAQDQVKETLKQPYETTGSIEWLPCFSLMQQVTMKYAKNATT